MMKSEKIKMVLEALKETKETLTKDALSGYIGKKQGYSGYEGKVRAYWWKAISICEAAGYLVREKRQPVKFSPLVKRCCLV